MQQHKHNAMISIDIGYKNLGYTIFVISDPVNNIGHDIGDNSTDHTYANNNVNNNDNTCVDDTDNNTNNITDNNNIDHMNVNNIDNSIVDNTTLTFSNITPIFDIFNITDFASKIKHVNIVESRCIAINTFFDNIAKQYNIIRIIIEKQVPNNTIAMELMYSIYTKSLQYCDHNDIIIFDPKLKFSSISETYDTKNKKHKRQSILYAENLIKSTYPSLLQQFNSHPKKDDIADSFNMLVVNMISRNDLDINFDQLRKLYGL